MESKLEYKSLEEIAEVIDSRHKTPQYSDTGFPMVRVVDVKGGLLRLTDTKKVNQDVYKDFSKGRDPQIGDLVISRVGSYGNVAYVGSEEKFCLGQNTAFIIPKDNSRFLYYALISPLIKRQIDEMVVGAVQKTISLKTIKNLKIPEPSDSTKERVSKILSDLDNRIELNRQTNQTLEQMAQALFKSWFVDFDPVIDNALAAGNDIPQAFQHKAEQRQKAQQLPDFKALPDDIRALFPSEFEHTDEPNIGIAGWIPKGWKPTSIHDMVDTISDTYKLKEVDEVIFLNTGDIEDGKFLHKDYSSTDGLPGQAKKSIAKGDILYSEIRPKNKRYAYVDFDSEEYVVSTKLMVLRAKENINPLLPYFILTQDKTVNELQHVAEHRSGTFPQITFKELAKVLAVFPQGPELIDLFVEQYLTPLFTKKLASIEQNEQLEKLRDTLLPKLISGEVPLKSE